MNYEKRQINFFLIRELGLIKALIQHTSKLKLTLTQARL
jgi:hypothetical protein